ncbi:allophanate hydrolase subunit 1, partial [Streptomyces sp. SID5926]|nr:allophanate hydrolase subunit 1 [Streptomyces sp. SID5926]
AALLTPGTRVRFVTADGATADGTGPGPGSGTGDDPAVGTSPEAGA